MCADHSVFVVFVFCATRVCFCVFWMQFLFLPCVDHYPFPAPAKRIRTPSACAVILIAQIRCYCRLDWSGGTNYLCMGFFLRARMSRRVLFFAFSRVFYLRE